MGAWLGPVACAPQPYASFLMSRPRDYLRSDPQAAPKKTLRKLEGCWPRSPPILRVSMYNEDDFNAFLLRTIPYLNTERPSHLVGQRANMGRADGEPKVPNPTRLGLATL